MSLYTQSWVYDIALGSDIQMRQGCNEFLVIHCIIKSF